MIHQLARELTACPRPTELDGYRLTTFAQFDADEAIARWIQACHLAFAGENVPIRGWTPQRFRVEFLEKWWWNPQHLWFAECDTSDGTSLAEHGPQPAVAGSITLAMRGAPSAAQPAVNWLYVVPEHRRRGVGTLLLNVLERSCWEADWRRVVLETHGDWAAAQGFYQQAGYQT